MRLAKTLSKMSKEEVKKQLPDWFNGTVYQLGDEVGNPNSGETCVLDAAELSMYEAIKGAELVMLMGVAKVDRCIDLIDRGKDWFIAKNPSAYMILLD